MSKLKKTVTMFNWFTCSCQMFVDKTPKFNIRLLLGLRQLSVLSYCTDRHKAKKMYKQYVCRCSKPKTLKMVVYAHRKTGRIRQRLAGYRARSSTGSPLSKRYQTWWKSPQTVRSPRVVKLGENLGEHNIETKFDNQSNPFRLSRGMALSHRSVYA